MRIDIKGSDFSVTEPIRLHTENQLRRAFAQSRESVRQIVVRLGDTNGTRGGPDKYCRVLIYLKGAGMVKAKEAGVDLYSAISQSTQRAKRHVSERIQRRTRQKANRMPRTWRYAALQESGVDN